MRIYFVSDIHGSEVCFRKFLNSYAVYRPDLMIVGGDITGKTLVPLLAQGDGSFVAPTLTKEVRLKTDEELRVFERHIADTGAYTWRFTEHEYAAVGDDPARLDAVFRRAVVQRVDAWVRLAEDRLKDAHARLLISGGNDDFWDVDEVLQRSSRVECPDRRVVALAHDVELVSCGAANETPWHCPRDVSEDELMDILDKLIAATSAPTLIFNIHVPPYGTTLDSGPLLDANQRPKMGVGGMERAPVGSTAVARCIERYQPVLSLHGHVHESRGMARIGRTMALNPGSEYGNGLLRGVLVEVKQGRVTTHQWTCG